MYIILRNKYKFIVTSVNIRNGYKFRGSKRIPIKEAHITGYCNELYIPEKITTILMEEDLYNKRIKSE